MLSGAPGISRRRSSARSLVRSEPFCHPHQSSCQPPQVFSSRAPRPQGSVDSPVQRWEGRSGRGDSPLFGRGRGGKPDEEPLRRETDTIATAARKSALRKTRLSSEGAPVHYVHNKCSHPACRRVSVRIARSDRIWSQTAGDAQAGWVVICGRADRDGHHLRCGFRGNPEPPARRASCPPAVRQQPGGVPHFALSGCTCPTRPPQALHIALLQGLSSARAGRARSAACSGMASSPSGVGVSGAKPSTDADSLDPGLVLADLVRPA